MKRVLVCLLAVFVSPIPGLASFAGEESARSWVQYDGRTFGPNSLAACEDALEEIKNRLDAYGVESAISECREIRWGGQTRGYQIAIDYEPPTSRSRRIRRFLHPSTSRESCLASVPYQESRLAPSGLVYVDSYCTKGPDGYDLTLDYFETLEPSYPNSYRLSTLNRFGHSTSLEGCFTQLYAQWELMESYNIYPIAADCNGRRYQEGGPVHYHVVFSVASNLMKSFYRIHGRKYLSKTSCESSLGEIKSNLETLGLEVPFSFCIFGINSWSTRQEYYQAMFDYRDEAPVTDVKEYESRSYDSAATCEERREDALLELTEGREHRSVVYSYCNQHFRYNNEFYRFKIYYVDSPPPSEEGR